MWIVAIAWIYVVVLMAATETSVVAGIMTFFGYCVLPLSIVFYITGSKGRRARKAAAASAGAPAVAATGSAAAADESAGHSAGDSGSGSVDGGRS
jgi:cytochrome c biogenesis protein CcdA